MSGGATSGGNQSTTTTTSLPAWATPYAKDYLGAVFGQVFPGQTPYSSTTGGGGGVAGNPQNTYGSSLSLAQMPAGLNQSVAPFTDFQNTGLQLGGQQTGAAQNLADIGANTVGQYASGGMLGPNPYLNSYYNSAALPLSQQFAYSTDPALMAQAQQAGAFNSSGFQQAQGLQQAALAQGLGTLGANIYEPAYQFESGQALNAAQNSPNAVAGLYQPSQQLYGLGSAEQQQNQNVLNTNYQNAVTQANWPFNLLSQFGSALGQATGGAGKSVSVGPSPGVAGGMK